MRVIINSVPHREQRYDTPGDWYIASDGTWRISVSRLPDWRYWILVAIHELIEMTLCTHHNISSSMVDRFDMEFEENRTEGDVSEPGDSEYAPYHRDHCIATAIERLMCAELDVNWQEYEQALFEL